MCQVTKKKIGFSVKFCVLPPEITPTLHLICHPDIWSFYLNRKTDTPRDARNQGFPLYTSKKHQYASDKKKPNQMIDFLRRPPKKEKEKNGNRKGPFSFLLNSDSSACMHTVAS
jgi:hypothetical protein